MDLRPLTKPEEVFLNKVAQGTLSMSQAVHWFGGMVQPDRVSVLYWLVAMIQQARGSDSDVELAIKKAQLKPTYTPCVLLLKPGMKVQLSKLLRLPEAEWEKTFRLLLSMFEVADERRRSFHCRGQCAHWWHQDITSEGE